jgi:hypothetical protein
MSREDQDHRFMARDGELKAFIEQTGRRPGAESKDTAAAALGRWTTTQQTLRNAGQLAADRLKLMEDLGARWRRLESKPRRAPTAWPRFADPG